MRILIAGDDAPSLQTIAQHLRGLGHDVVGQARGLTVLTHTARLRPDLVVLDLDLQGTDLDPIVQQIADEQRIAVVVVAGPRVDSAAKVVRRGVGAVVSKPVSEQNLGVAVEVAAARVIDMQDLRRQTDEAQRERVRLLQVFAASADGIYIARREGTLSMINDAAIRLLGMNLRDMRGRRLADWAVDFHVRGAGGQVLPPEALPLSRALQGDVVGDFEMWIDALDGTTRCLRLSAAPVTNGEGVIVEAVAVMRDVTTERSHAREIGDRADRRRRELGLLSSELLGATSPEELARRCVARVREALGASRVRMLSIGSDGKTRVLSGEMGRPLPGRGVTMPPGGLGLTGYVFFRNETVHTGDLWLEERFSPDESERSDRGVIAAPLALGDRVLGVLACASDQPNFFDDEDAHLVSLMANQAAMALENLHLADQIAAEQKMSALGVMAAGIVHEIKNPLSFVQANVESAKELLDMISGGEVPLEPQRIEEDRAALADALAGCSRLFKIIDDIKTYAHPGRAKREMSDVNRLVEVALTLATAELRRWCRVSKNFVRLPEVSCDGAKISQVVLNLLVNASQAIATTGRLGTIEVTTRMGDGTVRITVADDGPGMPPEMLDKIFLPFFTTKPAGVGTGLGLAISRRLMESQGGTIEVESEPNLGARFTIVLPVEPVS